MNTRSISGAHPNTRVRLQADANRIAYLARLARRRPYAVLNAIAADIGCANARRN